MLAALKKNGPGHRSFCGASLRFRHAVCQLARVKAERYGIAVCGGITIIISITIISKLEPLYLRPPSAAHAPSL